MGLGFLELLFLAILTLFAGVAVAMIGFAVWAAGKPDKNLSKYVARKLDNQSV